MNFALNRRISFCIVVLALGRHVAALAATDQRVGNITFTVPSGWQSSPGIPEEQGRMLILPDSAGGPPKGILIVLSDVELKGNFKEAFSEAVAAATQDRKAQKTSEILATKDPKGNSLLAQGLLCGDGVYMSFLAAQFGQRMELVFCQTKDPQVLQQLVRTEYELVAGMRIANQPGAKDSSPSSAAAKGTPEGAAKTVDEGRFRKGDVAGVWMGFTQSIGSHEPRPRWHTFFEDGQVFQDLPRAGLRSFDRAASKADKHLDGFWRTYTFRDGSGLIERVGSAGTRITAVKPGQIKLDDTSYYRCADVDGLRLDGAWTTYAQPDDPALMKQPIGQRPIFRFQKNGAFTDEGVFASILKSYGENVSEAAGSGTYEIKDFTLTLRYGDNHVRSVCITGLLSADPATNDKVLYLSRTEFFKMKP